MAPTNCAATKPGALAGEMPANVSVNVRPIVTAGFANDVDEVNQYGRADVRADRGRCRGGPVPVRASAKMSSSNPRGRDDLSEPESPAGAAGRRPGDRRHAEHHVGQDGAADRAADLGGNVGGEVAGGDAAAVAPAQPPVDQRDDRVEMRPGHSGEHQDQRAQRQRRRDRRFPSSSSPTSCGDSRVAAMPEPTTAVTSSAVPVNSPAARRASDRVMPARRSKPRAAATGRQPLRQDPVVDPGATPLAVDQPGLAEHPQVVGDRRTGDRERVGQLTHAHLATTTRGDQRQQPQPHRIAERLEAGREIDGPMRRSAPPLSSTDSTHRPAPATLV